MDERFIFVPNGRSFVFIDFERRPLLLQCLYGTQVVCSVFFHLQELTQEIHHTRLNNMHHVLHCTLRADLVRLVTHVRHAF